MRTRLMRRLTSLGDKMNWKDTLRKELDPVGQEDGDIDNDGDKDKTDEYLLNRRKKITEEVEKGNCGCGQDPCKTYGVVMVKKGKGERHFFEDGEQWTGPTHKHPDGTLMSGEEHEEGKSKKLYHFYELSEKALRHLSKDTTRIE